MKSVSDKTRVSTLYPVLLLIALLAASTLSQQANAQNEGRWYQVEILIFKRLSDSNLTGEIWPQNLSLRYPENTRHIDKVMPKNVHELDGHNYTLRKNGSYQVLFHKAWTQQMWEEERSPSLIIRGGQRYGKHQELEGTIKIHIGRYLHVTTDLWLSDFTIPEKPIIDNEFINEHQIKSVFSDTPMKLPKLPRQSDDSAQNATEYFVEDPQPSQIIALKGKRRMRSKETHYIDHPLMGVLVRMLPMESPEGEPTETQQQAALQ